MKSQNILVLTIILAVIVVTISNVSAARLLSEDFNGIKDDFSKYNYVYETAKYNLTYWIQRLSSGSSGGGDVKGSVPELLHNQGPSFDSGSIGNSIIENMNRIFLARQHPFSAEEIWEGGKMLGATPVSDEVEIVARITTMEE
ncbi:hypothetical protein Ancab_008416 [Ancistrocladus abbreviatus]